MEEEGGCGVERGGEGFLFVMRGESNAAHAGTLAPRAAKSGGQERSFFVHEQHALSLSPYFKRQHAHAITLLPFDDNCTTSITTTATGSSRRTEEGSADTLPPAMAADQGKEAPAERFKFKYVFIPCDK